MKKYLHYTKDQQAAIDRLHELLEAQGVNTKDPKRGGFSDSALFRWLVEQKLQELETENRCPLCGGELVRANSDFGYSLACSGCDYHSYTQTFWVENEG